MFWKLNNHNNRNNKNSINIGKAHNVSNHIVSDRFLALYHLKQYTLDNLSKKYGFNSSVASMKCAVTDCFGSIVLCDM